MDAAPTFRRNLLRWYAQHRRSLPWRESSDPYRIWVSEVMLQQTRVNAVLPYYERFLARFPDIASLAAAPEQELLAAWAGLGYYSRARNVQKAARQIIAAGDFPQTYEAIRALSGVGDYTAAAVASIAFSLPHAAIDGNVARVLSRVSAEPGDIATAPVRQRLRALVDALLDRKQPGDFNQAMMELGATICLPTNPKCLLCPVAQTCQARQQGRQHEFPIKRSKGPSVDAESKLLLVQRKDTFLLWQRPAGSRRLAGFWELPEPAQLPQARLGRVVGEFRHTIVNTTYRVEVREAKVNRTASGFVWIARHNLSEVPLSTITKKAIACLDG